jgi:hypothetical protein
MDGYTVYKNHLSSHALDNRRTVMCAAGGALSVLSRPRTGNMVKLVSRLYDFCRETDDERKCDKIPFPRLQRGCCCDTVALEMFHGRRRRP